MSIVKAFNEHFDEFVSDVERAFPDDTDIATAHTALTALRKSNPKLILTTYRDWVATPYKSQIEVGDIGFFVNKDYGGDLKEFGCGESGGAILSKIDMLREPVSRMNSAEQDKVIAYLQNLTKLCGLYVS
jgi:hypothetical protein